jgi:hypothetical protein
MPEKKRRKGQVWSMDFIIAVSMFTIAIVLYFKYAGSTFDERQLEIDELSLDARSIAGSLLTPGYPHDWNSTDVIRIGISDDGHAINETKLSRFLNLSSSNYSGTKGLFGTTYNFHFRITTQNDSVIAETGRNESGTSKMVSSTERTVLFGSEICYMSIQVWK